MAGGKTFGAIGLAVALILLFAINFSSADNFYQDAARPEDEADSTRASSLIDGDGRLRLGWRLARNGKDDSATVENGPIVGTNATEPRRRKRFVFLLPLVPLFGGLSAGTVAAGAAAVGVGTAAAVAVASHNGPIELPRFQPAYYGGSSTYMESKTKTKETTTAKPREGQLPPGQDYHTKPDELPAFPDFEKTTQKNNRPRWRHPKTKEFVEWDKMHGELEKYNRRGEHQGAFDHVTGKQRKPEKPGRTSPP